MNNNNPWLGLRTYTENDKIYGRDKEKVQLANFIKSNMHTIIYGKSGVGKSSLLQAGVFPLLRDEDMFPVYMRLEHNSDKPYLEQIKDAVLTASSFRIESRENTGNSLKQFLTETNFIDDDIRCRQYPVLVFDQFEEIFTLTDTAHKHDVASFFDQIADVLDVQEPYFRIVICLREDYLYYLEQNSVRIPDLKRNRFSLKALNKEQATEIITKPCHGIVADDVVERILNKVSLKNADEYEPAILSLFMFSLYEKMKSSRSDVISNELVDTFGDNIIIDFYNSSTQNISDSSMEFIEEHLLTDGGYRHNIPVDDAHNHGVTDVEIKQLVDNRIVTKTPRFNNVEYLEYSHDILCTVAVKSRNERRLRIQKLKNEREKLVIDELKKRQQAMLRMQSRATAGVVMQKIEQEDTAISITALLEVMPKNIRKANRPFVGEAVLALQKLDGVGLHVVMCHKHNINTATFSPDGHYVLVASYNTVRIWDVQMGTPVGKPIRHKDSIEVATFSPDGLYVVTGSVDTTARIWDVHSRMQVGVSMHHDGNVNIVEFSPDGRCVVTVSFYKTARIWDAATGNPVGEPMRHEDKVNTASFSLDSHYVLTASDDNTARIWDAATGKPVGEPMRHDSNVNTASFSPDSRYVVTASWDGTARIWDAATGNPVGKPMRHDDRVNTASFSPDGRYVVTASDDKTARIWDAATGNPVGEPMRHDDYVNSASFSPNGHYVVTASWNGTARIWDTNTRMPAGEPMRHKCYVNTAMFSPDGHFMLTVPKDNTARIWDLLTRTLVDKHIRHENIVRTVAFSPDGHCVVTASCDKTARIWDAATGNPVGEPMRHDDYVNSASFSPNGRYVVTSSWDGTARIWDATTGNPVGEPMSHGNRINTVSFSPDGRYVVAVSRSKTAMIWDAHTGKLVGDLLHHRYFVNTAEFSPDGRYVVTSSRDKTARIWHAATGNPVGEPMQHDDYVKSASFSPNGRYVVTTSGTKTVRIWDAATWKPVGEPMRNDSEACSASFSPDGCYVVTASWLNTAKIWDAASHECVYDYEGNFIAMSPDMKTIAIVKGKEVIIKPFIEPQQLINKYRKMLKNFKLTPEERRKYYLE